LRQFSGIKNDEQDRRRTAGMSHLANSTNFTTPLTLANFSFPGFTNDGASFLVSNTLQTLSQGSGGGILPDFNTVQSSFFGNTTFTPVRPNSFTFTQPNPSFPAFTGFPNGAFNFSFPDAGALTNAAAFKGFP
jgi:hypothetical protein